MPDLLLRHALHVPVMPDRLIVMPDPDRASLPLQIAGREIAGQAGNDDMVPCTSFFFVMSSFSYVMPDRLIVMPDSDRASQIAGQAGNDVRVPCTSFSSVMPDRLIVMPDRLIVMPDSDRASLPHQIAGQEIAGQAGNDERKRNDDSALKTKKRLLDI